jgi:hypothetical protein
MIYRFKKWLRDRKMLKLRMKLAGEEAALQELRRYGQGNWVIAERIGELKYLINHLEGKP